MGSQEGPCTFSRQRRCLSLGPANLVVSCQKCGTSAADRAIDSSELRLTTDREGRQVGQHRSHIVAAVSSACLIARAAASGSQGRIVSSLSPGAAGRVQTSACLLSGVICRRSVRPIRSEFSDDWRVYLYVLLEISPNLPSDQPYSFGKSVLTETNGAGAPFSHCCAAHGVGRGPPRRPRVLGEC